MDDEMTFFFINENKNVKASHEQTTLEALIAAKIEISHSCGGMGTCGTCRIFVEGHEGQIEERNEIELEMATERSFLENERLACQFHAKAGMKIRRA